MKFGTYTININSLKLIITVNDEDEDSSIDVIDNNVKVGMFCEKELCERFRFGNILAILMKSKDDNVTEIIKALGKAAYGKNTKLTWEFTPFPLPLKKENKETKENKKLLAPNQVKKKIEFSQNETNNKIKKIKELEKKHKKNYPKHVTKHLLDIIKACDEYIDYLQILRLIGSTTTYEKAVAPILEIQRRAVNYWYLPEAKTRAKARWSLLKNFFISKSGQSFSNSRKIGMPKAMDFEYFSEYYYRGNTLVAQWVKGEGSSTSLSFKQLCEKIKGIRGIGAPPLYESNTEKCKITIINGLLNFEDKLLTTESYSSFHKFRDAALYVCDPMGNIYTSTPKDIIIGTEMHHSVLLGGTPALCAGIIKVSDGKITYISNESGHYKPSTENLFNFLSFLKNQGLDLKDTQIEDVSTKKTFNGFDEFSAAYRDTHTSLTEQLSSSMDLLSQVDPVDEREHKESKSLLTKTMVRSDIELKEKKDNKILLVKIGNDVAYLKRQKKLNCNYQRVLLNIGIKILDLDDRINSCLWMSNDTKETLKYKRGVLNNLYYRLKNLQLSGKVFNSQQVTSMFREAADKPGMNLFCYRFGVFSFSSRRSGSVTVLNDLEKKISNSSSRAVHGWW